MFKNHSTIIKKVFSRAYTPLLFFCCLVFTIVISSPLEAKYGIKKFVDSHIIRKGILYFRVLFFIHGWKISWMLRLQFKIGNSDLLLWDNHNSLRLIKF